MHRHGDRREAGRRARRATRHCSRQPARAHRRRHPYVGQTCNTNATLPGQYSSYCFGSDFVGLYSSAAGYLKMLGTVKKAVLPFVLPAMCTDPDVIATSTTAALRAAKAVPMFPSGGAAYTCDSTAYAGLEALRSVQSHVVESQGGDKWLDKGLF